MDEKGASDGLPVDWDKNGGVYPMYFGVSCAFAALHLLSSSKNARFTKMKDDGWVILVERMLQGSAQLLGMLVWNAQRQEGIGVDSDVLRKLHQTQAEIEEMKKRRREDARANAKVVAIYASQEQSWISERKKLVQHLQSALKNLHELETRACSDCSQKEDTIYRLNEALVERDLEVEAKGKALEEEEKHRLETEKKLERAEAVAEELREMLDKEAREHSSEIWKHKTAFVELVSSQRQLEAEMARVVKQVEAAKLEVDAVLAQKEEATAMADKLSMELVRMQKDSEQKDKIVSAMLRKFKLDSGERQKLLKDLKIMRAKRRQAELEIERLANLCESKDNAVAKHAKNLKNVSTNKPDMRSEIASDRKALLCMDYGSSHNSSARSEKPSMNNPLQTSPKALLLDYLEPEFRKDHDHTDLMEKSASKEEYFDEGSPPDDRDLVITTSVKQLEDLVQSETEKYTTIIEQRHDEEVEAFAEQMRLKDEKLEACHWRILSMELESKRLQSHIGELNENLSQLRTENIRLESLLLSKEKDLKAVNDRYTLHIKNCQNDTTAREISPVPGHEAIWSEVKVIRRNLRGKEQEQKPGPVRVLQDMVGKPQERENCLLAIETKLIQAAAPRCEQEKREAESMHVDSTKPRAAIPSENNDNNSFKTMGNYTPDEVEQEGVVKTVIETSDSRVKEELPEMDLRTQGLQVAPKEKVGFNKNDIFEGSPQVALKDKAQIDEKVAPFGQSMIKKESSWKMDIHALAVSYKIKRLKQLLLIMERLTECQTPDKHGKEKMVNSAEMKGLLSGISLLRKQLKRYQTLEEKTDDLCKRMHASGSKERSKDSESERKEQTGTLQLFLEETFQVQRYMVATGQKLVEIMSETTCPLSGSFKADDSLGVDMKQFADNIRSLLKEIQRGLEVRIARIIGDVEGTLACQGFLRSGK
ncbi:uncharacterized protein LOC116259849 [Nymphaea colorata]|nr:uncharacterized protein LOC116259849 [Nymphaea colorata]XP_031493665.1 uncharacterized protein LOC116259849 [Nymphaea colorata]